MSHQDVIPYLQKAGVIRHNFTLKKDRSALFLKPDERALNDLVKALTTMGYKATDQTREAALGALDRMPCVRGPGSELVLM